MLPTLIYAMYAPIIEYQLQHVPVLQVPMIVVLLAAHHVHLNAALAKPQLTLVLHVLQVEIPHQFVTVMMGLMM